MCVYASMHACAGVHVNVCMQRFDYKRQQHNTGENAIKTHIGIGDDNLCYQAVHILNTRLHQLTANSKLRYNGYN